MHTLTVRLLMPSENAPICLTVPSESSICHEQTTMWQAICTISKAQITEWQSKQKEHAQHRMQQEQAWLSAPASLLWHFQGLKSAPTVQCIRCWGQCQEAGSNLQLIRVQAWAWRQHPDSVQGFKQCLHDCRHLTCSNRSKSSSSYRRMSKPGLNPFWELPDAWPSSIGQTYSSPSSCFFFLRFPKLLKVSFFGFKSKQKDTQR